MGSISVAKRIIDENYYPSREEVIRLAIWVLSKAEDRNTLVPVKPRTDD